MENTNVKLDTAKRRVFLALIASLTLGLAPFRPEPHLVEKIKWVVGGGEGMQTMDYFDLLMHGTPWILLVIFIVVYLRVKSRNDKELV